MIKLDFESTIGGKTHSEILAMKYWTRTRWYKKLLQEGKQKEKEEAMKIVEIARRVKISVSNTGKTHTEETKAKISLSKTGKTHTKETCIKMSISKMGENNPMKRPEIRAGFMGENNPNYIDGRSSNPQYHKRRHFRNLGLPDEFVESALNQKKKRTDIEMMMEYWLINNEVLYEFQKYINLPSTWTRVDFFIKPNICLYCDGNRYHKQEEIKTRDERITKELELMGYKVIRIWGSDIHDGIRPWEILELPQLKYEQQLLKNEGE